MASDKSRENQRVIVIPEPSLAVDVNNSTFNEASPKAGVPVPSKITQLALTGAGGLTENLDMQIVSPGFPINIFGPTSGQHSGSRSIWRKSSDGPNDWRGYDSPRPVSAWEGVIYNNVNVTSISHIDSVKTHDTDTVLAVCHVIDVGTHPGTLDNRIEVQVRNPSTGVFTRVVIESEVLAPSQDYIPCIFSLPSGRLQVYRLLEDGYLRMWYSDDGGVTWAHGSDGLLSTPLANVPSITRARVAYDSGQVVIMFLDESASPNVIETYASSDLGNTFIHTESLEAPAGYDVGYFDITGIPSGGFCMVIQGWEASDDSAISSFTIPDAYSKWSVNASTSKITLGTVDTISTRKSDLTVAIDDNNVLHAYYNYFSDGGGTAGNARDGIVGSLSYDSGKSWFPYTTSVSSSNGDIVSYSESVQNFGLTEISGVFQRGRLVMFHKWDISPNAKLGTAGVRYPLGGTYCAGNMGALYLGGHTTISYPSSEAKQDDVHIFGWRKAWFPTERPSNDSDWISTGSGITDIIGPPAYLDILSTSTTALSFKDVTSTTEVAMAAKFVVSPQGGATNSLETAVRCAVVTGANKVSCSIRLASTGFEVWDEGGTPARISDIILGDFATNPIEVWVELDTGGYATVQYREWGTGEDRVWTKVLSAGFPLRQLLPFAATLPTIEWGALVNKSSAGNLHSYWSQMLFTVAPNRATGVGGGTIVFLVDEQKNPEDLRGQNMSGNPYLSSNAYVSSRNGPTWRGERWTIPSEADFSVQNALTNPSPRVGWRSTDLTQQTITLTMDTTPTYGPRKVLAVMLRDTNIAEYELFGFDGTSYVSLGTISNKISGLVFTRDGSSVRPGAVASPTYLKHGEFIDGEFSYTDTSVSRKILRHSEGVWDSGHALTPVVRIAGAQFADALTGTGTIVPNQCISLVELSADYSRFRIVVPSSATYTPADDYFKIGSIVVGWCYPLGADYAWGRSITTVAPAEVIQTRDMQKRVKSLAPLIRKVSIAWTDGIDQTGVEPDDADPNYVKIGTEAGAADVGTAYALEGMFRELSGESGSIIYMPNVPALTGLTTFSRRRDAIHGRFTMSDYVINTVQGEEHVDEVSRISTVTITEDV